MKFFENKCNCVGRAFQMERGGTPVSVELLGPSYFIFYCVPPAYQLLPSINYPRGLLSVSPPPLPHLPLPSQYTFYSAHLWKSAKYPPKGSNERTDCMEEQTYQKFNQYFPLRCVIYDTVILMKLLLKNKKVVYQISST